MHQAAADALARIQSAGRPKPTSVKKPKDDAEGAPVQYPVRAFVVTWTELDQWWTHYDPAVLAVELTDEQVATFLRVIEQTVAFAGALQAALTNPDAAARHLASACWCWGWVGAPAGHGHF